MPDRVELLGEEELMPGRKWLVYRNRATGQLSKVPKEIMDNPRTAPLMMNHLTGYATQRGGEPAQLADPQSEFLVQGKIADTLKMGEKEHPTEPWRPPGKDYVPTGMGNTELPVPQSPQEVIGMLRQRLSGVRPDYNISRK